MKNKWGSEFDKYYQKINNAVTETKDEVMTYGGDIIESFYFAMSGGYTQDASTVFNETKEYLQGVESIFDTNSLNGYEVTKEFSKEDFINSLNLNCNNVSVDYINYNESGYVDEISVCGQKISGTKFRFSLGLRSSNFDIELSDTIKITTRGYGHGVGMSQYGANGYASAGYTYVDILKHYYTGVEIQKIKDV
jgi:stage II sporulation protein D